MSNNLPTAEVIEKLVKDKFSLFEIAQMFGCNCADIKKIVFG